jgi:hypothetical protein
MLLGTKSKSLANANKNLLYIYALLLSPMFKIGILTDSLLISRIGM